MTVTLLRVLDTLLLIGILAVYLLSFAWCLWLWPSRREVEPVKDDAR